MADEGHGDRASIAITGTTDWANAANNTLRFEVVRGRHYQIGGWMKPVRRRPGVIVLDTSVLVDALTGPRRSAPALRRAIANGERLLLPSLVLYEWLRGPRVTEELAAQEALFPPASALPFGPAEAARASQLYVRLRRGRGRDVDLAIAACALTLGARLWTLNPRDFRDLEGLELYLPA